MIRKRMVGTVLILAVMVAASVVANLGSPIPASATSTWTIASSPNRGTARNELGSVSCASAVSCKAVGYYYTSTAQRTLIESWNGHAWSSMQSANRGIWDNALSAVSCVSANRCMAVGDYASSIRLNPLTELWNGTAWSMVTSPTTGTSRTILTSVSCTSATFCAAVGFADNAAGTAGRTIVESWNGSKWAITPSPSPGTISGLWGVSCTSSASCVAVGSRYVSGPNIDVTLIESWNGSTWSILPSGNIGASSNYLSGVSCVSASDCTTVGSYYDLGQNGDHSLIESWDGSTWSIVPSANVGGDDLYGVSCPSADSCTAVGTYVNENDFGALQTLIETWNGTAWALAPSPNRKTQPGPVWNDNRLIGVACVLATTCEAVGYYLNGVDRTLIESY